MSYCELCGSEVDSLVEAKISGAKLQVCDGCASLGETTSKDETETSDTPTVKRVREPERPKTEDSFEDEVEELVYDYDDVIQKGREEKDLTREELANMLNERESLLKRLENGNSLPSEEVQHKLESELDIELTKTGGGL